MRAAAILGVDPGTAKCGLAAVSREGQTLYRAVVELGALTEALAELGQRFALGQVALGNRTGAGPVQGMIREALPEATVSLVAEHRSTEEARRLYWEYHPPRGWRRLVPLGLMLPPEPLDAYAAEIVARRWLGQGETGPES